MILKRLISLIQIFAIALTPLTSFSVSAEETTPAEETAQAPSAIGPLIPGTDVDSGDSLEDSPFDQKLRQFMDVYVAERHPGEDIERALMTALKTHEGSFKLFEAKLDEERKASIETQVKAIVSDSDKLAVYKREIDESDKKIATGELIKAAVDVLNELFKGTIPEYNNKAETLAAVTYLDPLSSGAIYFLFQTLNSRYYNSYNFSNLKYAGYDQLDYVKEDFAEGAGASIGITYGITLLWSWLHKSSFNKFTGAVKSREFWRKANPRRMLPAALRAIRNFARQPRSPRTHEMRLADEAQATRSQVHTHTPAPAPSASEQATAAARTATQATKAKQALRQSDEFEAELEALYKEIDSLPSVASSIQRQKSVVQAAARVATNSPAGQAKKIEEGYWAMTKKLGAVHLTRLLAQPAKEALFYLAAHLGIATTVGASNVGLQALWTKLHPEDPNSVIRLVPIDKAGNDLMSHHYGALSVLYLACRADEYETLMANIAKVMSSKEPYSNNQFSFSDSDLIRAYVAQYYFYESLYGDYPYFRPLTRAPKEIRFDDKENLITMNLPLPTGHKAQEKFACDRYEGLGEAPLEFSINEIYDYHLKNSFDHLIKIYQILSPSEIPQEESSAAAGAPAAAAADKNEAE